jgi:hypothetical protein
MSSGRPAELYAGTYTGFCYECQNGGDYVFLTEKDGAKHISCPPSCPSWRRDRETFIAYGDCPSCNGIGYSWKSGRYDSYRSYCEPCLNKHSNNKFRIKYFRIAKKLYNKYNDTFLSRIKTEEKKLKAKLDNKQAAELVGDLFNIYSLKIKKLGKILEKSPI